MVTLRRTRRARRGITLIETMIALVVLTTGIAAVFGMASHVHNANRTLLFQTRSVDAFGRLVAQIQNARCDYNPLLPPGAGNIDPTQTDIGLQTLSPPGAPNWITVPIPGSTITYVGRTGFEIAEVTVPAMQIWYAVTPAATPEIPALDIEIRIQELTQDAAFDANPSSYYLRIYPMRKVCNARLDDSARGEY